LRQAITFGIIYGQSAFGLAKGLAIPVADAKQYIETYFARYPGIQASRDRECPDPRPSRGWVGVPSHSRPGSLRTTSSGYAPTT
jgi:DNA polymerase-1